MKHLLLTFDHELFLGRRSGTVRRCLLEPTETLRGLMEQHGLRGLFFVDALHLVRLEEAAEGDDRAREELDAVRGQLAGLAAAGHELFLHLHPHWLDARRDAATGTWDLSELARYRLESLDEAERGRVFERGMAALRRAAGPAAADLPFDAFRAGGWSIQPFSVFAPHFRQHGLRLDFSVLPGAVARTNAPRYDFRAAPDEPVYRFSQDPATPDPLGELVELSISRLPWTGWRRAVERRFSRVLWRTGGMRPLGDGVGVPVRAEPGAPADARPGCEMASAELLTSWRIDSYLGHLEHSDYLQLLSHPKMQSRHSLKSFATFLRRAATRFELTSDFRSLLPA